MLTDSQFIEGVSSILALIFFAGLFFWFIVAKNEKIAKETAEETKTVMDSIDKPDVFDKGKLKSISVEHTQETKEDIDFKIRMLKAALSDALAIGNQGTADMLRVKIDKLNLDRGAKESLEDIAMTKDTFEHTFLRRQNPLEHSVQFDFNPKSDDSWTKKYMEEGESIIDKARRLHKEMQENLDSEDYLVCARIQKELDQLCNPPTINTEGDNMKMAKLINQLEACRLIGNMEGFEATQKEIDALRRTLKD